MGQKRAETLPGATRKAEFRRGAFQAPVARRLTGHHSCGPRPEGAVDIADGILADDGSTLEKRHPNIFRHLERQRIHFSGARWNRRLGAGGLRPTLDGAFRPHQEWAEIQPSLPTRHAVGNGRKQVCPADQLIERRKAQLRQNLAHLGA